MKKYLIALAALCGFTMQAKADTDLTALKNVLYVENATLSQGMTQTLSLNLKNEVEVGGFQCKIYLPEGLSFEGSKTSVAGDRTAGKVFTATPKIQEDGSLMVVFYKGADNTIEAGDGQVVAIDINVPKTFAVGDYKVQVKETIIGGVDTEADIVESTLTVTDIITLDEDATEAPAAAENAKVNLLRKINANEWSTICLPFALDEAQTKAAFGSDVKLATFNGCDIEVDDDDYATHINVKFEEASSIAKNTPMLIKVSSPITSVPFDGVTIEPDKAEKKKAGNVFTGVYAASKVPTECLFLNDGKFYYSVGKTAIKGYRGYFKFKSYLQEYEDASVKVCIFIDGQATRVNELQDNVKANGAIFNLAGQRVSKAQKGIFIQNGKKTVIK